MFMTRGFKYLFLGLLCLSFICAAGCGKEKVQPDVSLTDIVDRVKEAYGDSYIPQMTLDSETLEQKYGLTEDMYKEALGEAAMIIVQVDEFVAVHANEGRADDVETALKDYQDYLINEAMNYPMNIGKINGSRVYRNGDYIFFIMLGDMSQEVMDGSEEEAKNYASEQNEIAVKAIDQALEGN